jgi:aminoglycoside 6'-N-acetyltransferase
MRSILARSGSPAVIAATRPRDGTASMLALWRYPRAMELHGRLVTLRPTTVDDAPALAAILAEPAVARWWGVFDLDRVMADLVEGDPGEDPFAIIHEGEVVGYIQAVEELEPDFRHAGIDLFLRTDVQGRRLGPDAIRTLARELIDGRGHHRLTIDPAAVNDRAIAAYATLGFRPVGIMRRYQRMADGRWVDALLMDLLAEELVR